MLDHYDITTLEQLRAISDILRVRIIDSLKDKPMTVTQLADVMGIAPAKVHYHVRELEKVGLLKLVETREKGGILEKYYLAVARIIQTSKALFTSGPQDQAIEAVQTLLEQANGGYIDALRRSLEGKGPASPNDINFTLGRLYMTSNELQDLSRKLHELLKTYEAPRGIEGEREFAYIMFNYPEPERETIQPATANQKGEDQQTTTVGVCHISKSSLERALKQGKPLHINVVGLCSIAKDVNLELAQATIEQFRLVGRLQASQDVYDYLMSIRQQ